jgi:hypothetical protein
MPRQRVGIRLRLCVCVSVECVNDKININTYKQTSNQPLSCVCVYMKRLMNKNEKKYIDNEYLDAEWKLGRAPIPSSFKTPRLYKASFGGFLPLSPHCISTVRTRFIENIFYEVLVHVQLRVSI